MRYDWLKDARLSEDTEFEEFYSGIRDSLINGQIFQNEINQFPPIDRATYFYSDSLSTPSKIIIVTKNGNHQKDKTENEDGDGRVTASIAKNWNRVQNAKICHHLSGDHGSLPKCDGFISYIEDLREQYTIKSNRKLKDEIYDDDTIIAAMVNNGALLEVPIRMENLFNAKTESILELNSKILRLCMKKEKKNEKLWLYAYNKGKAADDKEDLNNAKQFYALSLGLKPKSDKALYAANNLGYIMMKYNKNKVAKDYLEFALATKPETEKESPDPKYLGRVHNNLGIVTWNLGLYNKSAYHWNKAVEISDSQKAKNNLILLEDVSIGRDSIQ
jgi:tetratricopeptide (TPR) repeat protein